MGYLTIAAPASATYVEKKSEFIAQLAPVQTQEEVAAFIDNVRKNHRKARHNCYAYTLREGPRVRQDFPFWMSCKKISSSISAVW